MFVTAGATEAIAASLLALCQPGRRGRRLRAVLRLLRGRDRAGRGALQAVTLRPADGRFTSTPTSCAPPSAPRTRAILVNSPHNPAGTVFTRAELTPSRTLPRARPGRVTDEVYEHLVFDGAEHIPLATLPGMRERTVTISSAGKTFSVTGWKVGWVTAPPPLVSAVRTAKQFLTYAAARRSSAAAASRSASQILYEELRKSLQAKRDRLITGLGAAGFTAYRAAGHLLRQADIRPLGFSDGIELTRALPERAGVVAIPSQVFYDHADAGAHFVRFAFCKRDEVIDEAVERLARLR